MCSSKVQATFGLAACLPLGPPLDSGSNPGLRAQFVTPCPSVFFWLPSAGGSSQQDHTKHQLLSAFYTDSH